VFERDVNKRLGNRWFRVRMGGYQAISINYYAGLTYKLKKDLLISKYCLWGHTNVLQK
jgi:hypothetical protein